ncbi:MAG: OmpA family protein [Pseudomonadota bacterium]
MKKIYLMLCSVLCVAALGGCVTAKPPAPTANELLLQAMQDTGLEFEETDRGILVYLPALSFAYGSSDLLPEARDKLRFVADAVNADFAVDRKVAVEGHTDSKGAEAYNLELSKERSLSVADELIFSGVQENRMEPAWFGESNPRAPNENADGSDNPDGRALNRRVEIIILN